jgi:Amt family ammonium transporter
VVPYANWLSSGDNAWQLTAATLVGLMSIPALAVLYGGIVQRKWAINTIMMVFSAFAITLIVWVLWAFKMGFGEPWISTFVGKPGTVVGQAGEQGRASIPLLKGLAPNFRFPQGSLVYFQFVFAAITPILFIGSVLGRIKFKVWLIFIPLWITFAYAVNAFMLWGGGFWAGKGALDFSGGYVIHLAAGVSGFVAAAVIGPRLKRDRQFGKPNNLIFIALGAGILWLGWNGFNGGDPYFAGADASAAVVNTNLAAATALLAWIILDMTAGKEKKPTFIGGVNGMICGLVGITPAAGYVNGVGAILIGLICSVLVWVLFTYLPRKVWPFNKVDDALGVVYTHGFAGLFGGLLVGLLANPKMIVYLGAGKNPPVTTAGLFYGHPKQLLIQAGAALTIIVWDAVVTFLILRGIGLFTRLRMSDAELAAGDQMVHGEVAYPVEEPDPEQARVLAGVGGRAAESNGSGRPHGPAGENRAGENGDGENGDGEHRDGHGREGGNRDWRDDDKVMSD